MALRVHDLWRADPPLRDLIAAIALWGGALIMNVLWTRTRAQNAYLAFLFLTIMGIGAFLYMAEVDNPSRTQKRRRGDNLKGRNPFPLREDVPLELEDVENVHGENPVILHRPDLIRVFRGRIPRSPGFDLVPPVGGMGTVRHLHPSSRGHQPGVRAPLRGERRL
jgi:hypothetical protein